MDPCNCIDPLWPAEDLLIRYQYVADIFIALAYFSIPIELAYFVLKSSIFPYRGVLILFGLFIVLCGATHMISLWMVETHSRGVEWVMTVAKALTAVVSCGTALKLVQIIPDLLSVKTRELFLKNKADELDREMGLMRTEAETGKYVRMLTKEIRNSLVKHTILNTTLVELGKTLGLEECCLWMPNRSGTELELFRSLRSPNAVAASVPVHHPDIKLVFGANRAVVIPSSSPVAIHVLTAAGNAFARSSCRYAPGEVLAVRVPFLHLNDFRVGDWSQAHGHRPFALMVLVLPPNSARRWRPHELDMVDAVADQVAVAMSHASILEDSIKARDLLMQQNVELETARREAESADRARNNFMAVMNQEMRTPMNSIIDLTHRLEETSMTQDQRALVDTILRNSTLLAKLVNSVLDLSRLEDDKTVLDMRAFRLRAIFEEVMEQIKPVASVKKLALSLSLAADLPDYVLGDDRRLVQVLLQITGNAVKFTKEGSVSTSVRLEKGVNGSNDQHCYIRVQVRDTGQGFLPQDIPKHFNRGGMILDAKNIKHYSGTGLPISKRLVNLMEGHIWIESDGPGKGSVVTFIVKLQRCVTHTVSDDPEREPLLGSNF
ncbi:ethylene response two-component response regulator [Selaginella moellendorffii]|uniref:histidine kinase n=1 Tax=Selaginella moellendorffii TaxID=88036 RepID=D8R4U9_SELML|nr:ethylene receptor [Selaginella moellendorffii]XP_024526698.1 ethylene receptor [Selaginella moellendorffii]EFJ32375.1 ethylene response two-component response regulator [Selaginella moellendorffii]|eukprot:XP_002966348.1 ethylene receptor [Selaginella moellendorffii]